MRTSVSSDMTTPIPLTNHIIGALTNAGAQSLDKMGKIILILFIICLVSLVKTNLLEMQRHNYNNHISYYGYKSLSIPYKSVVYFNSYKACKVITYFTTFILIIGHYIQTYQTKFCTIIIYMGTW